MPITLRLLLYCIAVLIFQPTASGEDVFSTLTPDTTLQTNPIAIFGSPAPGGNELAASFSIGSSDVLLESASVPVNVLGPTGTDEAVTLSILRDLDGVADSVLASSSVSGFPSLSNLRVTSFSFEDSPVKLDSGETYFLAARTDSTVTFGWSLANVGTEGSQRWNRQGAQPWSLNTTGSPPLAFTVAGTVVPEPTSYSLMIAAALAGLGLRRRC